MMNSMKIKADYKELHNTVLSINENSDILESEIENIISQVDNLKQLWQGDDANAYYKNISDYMNNMKLIPDTYRALLNLIEQMNHNYEEIDKDYVAAIEKAVVNHE